MPNDRVHHPRYAEGRDALLDAATRVVARDGFAGLSYRTVAREAGTTHGLVSYHFGSRDGLIHETVAKARRDAIERSSLAATSGRLEDFARDLPQLAEEAPEAQILQFELALEAQRRPELGPEVRALYDAYLEVTRQALSSLGIDADDALARVAFATLDGLVLQHVVYRDRQASEEALAAFHSLLRRLLDEN